MRKIKLKGNEKFLVVRTDRIGDVILSTPVLEVIKSEFPESHLCFMLSSYTADVIKNNPYVDDVIIDDHERKGGGLGEIFKLIKETRKRGFDVAVVLRPTFRLALILFLAGVKYRIGTGFRYYQLLFNRKVYEHRKVNLRHEVEYNLDLLRPLGIAPRKIYPSVYLSPEEDQFSSRIFQELNIAPNDTVVLIHPGSGDSSLNLPPGRFAQVADKLIQELDAKIIFTGTEGERNLIDTIREGMEGEAFDLRGKTDLRQLAAILKKCDAVVSNSTGPMHLAVAVGTPTVAVFCPIFAAGPIRWGPYGEGHEVVLPPVPICLKCKPTNCLYYNCMEKISVDQIVSKIRIVLNAEKNSHKSSISKLSNQRGNRQPE
jgi:lipopolysaccharide heptosyltransferase II